MKYFLFFFIPVLFSMQATKYAVLGEKNPLIGEWEWMKDPTSSPYAPVSDIDWAFIHFSVGTDQSFGAIAYDDTIKGYACPCYFLAYSNGSNMMGTITNCCVAKDKNKTFNFNFQYDEADDELIITVKDETFTYKRKK